MIFVIMLLCTLSFFYFSLTIGQHFKRLTEQKKMPRQAFINCHLMAWTLLAVSLYPAVIHWPYQIGLVNWAMLLQLSALIIVVLLSYFPNSYITIGKKLFGVANPHTYSQSKTE